MSRASRAVTPFETTNVGNGMADDYEMGNKPYGAAFNTARAHVAEGVDGDDDLVATMPKAGGSVPEGYPTRRRKIDSRDSVASSVSSSAAPATGNILDRLARHKREKMISAQGRLNPCTHATTHPDKDPENTTPDAGSPKRQFLLALPLLAIMGGFIAIVCLGAGRFHESEYGIGWRALSHAQPFAMTLVGDPTVVSTKLVLPPWEEQAIDYSTGVYEMMPTQGYRRRLASLNAAHKRLGQMLAMPYASSRSLLSSSKVEIDATSLPVLQIFVCQNLTGAASPADFTPIAPASTCGYKADASVDCVITQKNVVRVDASLPCYIVVRILAPSSASEPELTASVYIEPTQMGTFGLYKEWIALCIVGLVLLGIAFEVFNRTWVAFCGAFMMTGLLMIANITPDLHTVLSWLDFGTLGLLFGMMVIVGQLQRTGVFEVMCAMCLRASKGNLLYLTLYLCLITAFLSAWLDNVTTVLLMIPMTTAVFHAMDRDPVPLLIAQAMLSNVGGTMTMIGDPPNIIIGNELRNTIGFIDFLENLAPGVLIAIPFALLTLVLLFKKELTGRVDDFDRIIGIVDKAKIKDWALFWNCIFVVGGVVLGFLLHPIHHLNPAWIALVGALVLVLRVERHDAHAVLHAVEWDMLLFFAGMFIMVEGAMELGLIRKIAAFLTLIIDTAPVASQQIAAIEVILWFSAIFSALLDNIPYTITMVPVIETLAASNPNLSLPVLAWALAFGACLGGNGTLIGASANIVTVGLAEKDGHHISFVKWLYAGVPVMVVTVAVANVYMLVRYGI
ncbi:hypothetical protein FOA52_012656 [Chlamydomonas sp. UWO 241]|nr:hypothetical protein FOA52_012656 [Chlamydomonas sp. UWO 241]